MLKQTKVPRAMEAFNNQASRRQLQPDYSVRWRGTLIIAIPVVCLITSTLIIAGLRSNTIAARKQEAKNREILTQTEHLMRVLVDAETGVRGYGLTGRSEFLQPYLNAKATLPDTLLQLEKMVSENPTQLQRFQIIQSLAQRQIELLEENVESIQSLETTLERVPQLTQKLVLSKSEMDALRQQVSAFAEQESRLRDQREVQVVQWRNLTTEMQWLTMSISTLAGAAAIYLFYQLDRELSERAKRLQESNIRQQAVFDNVVDGIITLDQQGYIESLNTAAAKIFEYELEEVKGLHLKQLVAEPFPDSSEALNYFLGANHNKLDRFQETIGRRKQNMTFPMELAISKLELNNQPYFLVIVRDITERKQSEADLLKQARLLDLANDMILVRDLNDTITYWNRGAERLYGFSAAEAIGKSVHRLLKTDFPQPLEEIQIQLLQKGEWKGELIHTHKNGCQLTVASSWTLQRDENGKPIANLEINKDITEAKLAEAALRKSEKLYRTLVKNFPNGAVFLFDPELRYNIAEGTGLETVGLSSEMLTGKSIWEVLPLETAQELEPIYRAALLGKTTVREISFADHIYRVYVLPVTEDGEVFAGMVVSQDITENKRAEEALRSRADELTHMTTVLAHTTAILEKRNQELDQFAYIVSHDLKAPLRAIANLSSWIEEDLDDRLDEDTRHQMDLLRGRVHRMEALINGLLQYSRVGRIKTDSNYVDVNELLAEIIDSVAPPPDFRIIVEPGMPTLHTEKIPLQQVFSNLISNAIKHHDRPKGKIVISAKDQGQAYEFAVADDGPGIAPAYHEKIFVMFQILQPRDQVENTGVGLAIVKKTVENQGGSIWVESQKNQGATFHFTWKK